MHVYFFIFILFYFIFAHFHFPASGQAVVTGVIPSPPRFLPSVFIAHRVQQSHCLSIVHGVLLTHALALSASRFVLKKKSQRIFTSMHSVGLELKRLIYTRLEDNLIRHRGDRLLYPMASSTDHDFWGVLDSNLTVHQQSFYQSDGFSHISNSINTLSLVCPINGTALILTDTIARISGGPAIHPAMLGGGRWHVIQGPRFVGDWLIIIFFFVLVLRQMRINKALAHHTSTYFQTRRVSI